MMVHRREIRIDDALGGTPGYARQELSEETKDEIRQIVREEIQRATRDIKVTRWPPRNRNPSAF